VSEPAGNPYDRVRVRWMQGAEMNALEAALWRASASPGFRAASVVVELLDTVPDFDRLVEGHRFGLARIPRLRQRVVDDPLRLGPPAWCDTHVDLDHHVRRVRLPPGSRLEDALEVAAELHTTTFDPTRPLWQGVLVEGLPDGRAVYLLKLHHALADGPAIIELFDLVHSDRRAPTAGKPTLPQGIHDARRPLGLTARHAAGLALGAPVAALRVVAGGAAALTTPARTFSGVQTTAHAIDRLVSGAPGTPSKLLRRRGPSRHFAYLEVPTAELRAVADATEASLGDVFLAGILGGLARYAEDRGETLGDVPVAIPTGVHLAGATMNRLARARIAGPAGVADPRERIRIAGLRAREVWAAPPVDLLRATAAIMSRAPTPVLERFAGGFTRACDLQLFTFRGLDREAYVAGAKVDGMAVFGPTAGAAATATVTSHGETCGIGLTTDPAAVTDPEALREAVRASFEELADLGVPGSLVA